MQNPGDTPPLTRRLDAVLSHGVMLVLAAAVLALFVAGLGASTPGGPARQDAGTSAAVPAAP